MILSHEVEAILKGTLSSSELFNALEHAQGGIHANVLPADRKAFTEFQRTYCAAKNTTPVHHQLDLLGGE